jgi:hypothetical protein
LLALQFPIYKKRLNPAIGILLALPLCAIICFLFPKKINDNLYSMRTALLGEKILPDGIFCVCGHFILVGSILLFLLFR